MHNYSPSPGALSELRIQRQSDVKKKLMSQATHLACNQTTNATFTYRHFFFIVIFFLAVNLEKTRYQDKALHNDSLIVSSISLILVTNVGHIDDKRPYLFQHFKLKSVLSEIIHAI